MTDWRPSASWQTLEKRSAFFHIRNFLSQRSCLEVQVPILQDGANIDHGIEVYQSDEQQYFCSSRTLFKTTLMCGCQRLFCYSSMFSQERTRRKHQPTFYMLEWYRKSWTLEAIIQETCSIIESCVGKKTVCYSYREAFLAFCNKIRLPPAMKIYKSHQ